MVWWMYAGMGAMSIFGGLKSNAANTKAAKAAKAMQEYNNKMARISDALNQNAITSNVTTSIQASAREAIELQKNVRTVTGAAEVQAASTDTVGRSVDMVMHEISRGAAQQEYTRQEDLKAVFLQADQQRKQSALSAKLNQDNSYIPTPNTSDMLFDISNRFVGSIGTQGVTDLGQRIGQLFGASSGIQPGSYGQATGQGNTSALLLQKYKF